MSKLDLTTENLHEILSRQYLSKVLASLRGIEGSTVRFGETGTGMHPNYERTFPDRLPHTLRGSTHKPYDGTAEFNKESVSRAFTLQEITEAYEKAK